VGIRAKSSRRQGRRHHRGRDRDRGRDRGGLGGGGRRRRRRLPRQRRRRGPRGWSGARSDQGTVGPVRCPRSGADRRPVRRDAVAVRAGRHPDQQRRDHGAAPAAGVDAGGVGPNPRHQPPGRVLLHPARGPGDDPPGAWGADRQPEFGPRHQRGSPPRPLRGEQGRDQHADQSRRDRARPPQHPGERHRPRRDRGRALPHPDLRPRGPGRPHPRQPRRLPGRHRRSRRLPLLPRRVLPDRPDRPRRRRADDDDGGADAGQL
ncbi:MAG: 3-oxoacyl-[acyl-carrier protein] reductase, partial [uncultured Thermomicrobiales bacterium]